MFQMVISIVIGYLFGSFSTGFFIGKIYKIDDIRKYGSGNSGATNALRIMGKKAGAITFLGDALKVIIPMLIIRFGFRYTGMDDLDMDSVLSLKTNDAHVLSLITGFGAVLGHNFPFYLKFKGGKGITVTALAMLVFDWRFGLVAFIIFTTVIAITKYVSLASLILSLSFPVCMLIYYGDKLLIVISLCFTILAFIRHRENIKRLVLGTENKLGQKNIDT